MSIESIIVSDDVTEVTRISPENAVHFPVRNQQARARRDIIDGIKMWRIWTMLAYQDVKLRYRRSILGPFWLTLSMAITVYSMGYLYGHLFHTNLQTYFPFLVAGMMSWAILSTCITELTDAFVTADGLIKQIKLPYSLYIHRVVTRNIIIFFHNLIVLVPILAIYHEVAKLNYNTLFLPIGLLIFYFNAITFGLALAMIGARYRDLSQIIKSLVQVAFFVTPVMWNPALLPDKDHYLVVLNPFYAFVELIRAPLLGQFPSLMTFFITACITTFGIFLAASMFVKYRARVIYWL
jgi:lipopolysaccharide transport system permease protein